jgi:hypothetical protein
MTFAFTTNSYGAPHLSILTQRWAFGIGSRCSISVWVMDQASAGILIPKHGGNWWVVMVPRTPPEKT